MTTKTSINMHIGDVIIFNKDVHDDNAFGVIDYTLFHARSIGVVVEIWRGHGKKYISPENVISYYTIVDNYDNMFSLREDQMAHATAMLREDRYVD